MARSTGNPPGNSGAAVSGKNGGGDNLFAAFVAQLLTNSKGIGLSGEAVEAPSKPVE